MGPPQEEKRIIIRGGEEAPYISNKGERKKERKNKGWLFIYVSLYNSQVDIIKPSFL